ncbi:thioesterase II family protein [Streptacidiphilus sp. P02-A3a]|uniref:thioesterase II family protein n=1 Tax=Streptacidiphilus sp. P02-A3a TaxID=2704468 RepID=UPI0015FE6778|nr:alpha/beta fold hydrolase [Streptacidiphilus sp. P02-A3a]QMU69836.1 thioesterase [Streptacidiphilus sp. P02-A3a]
MSPSSPDNDLWCRRYRPTDTATARLVCLPHAGGSASFFLPVSAALSPGVDVVSIQYPGRQDRRGEQPLTDLSPLADQVHAVLRQQPELPLTFFGHSMGASLAFEVIRRMEADGRYPVRLFASGRRAPSVFREETVHRLDDNGLIAEIRRLNGTSSRVLDDDEMMRAALPALRADYQAAELYRSEPGTTIACPVTVLTGDRDPKTSLDDAQAWSRHTTADSFEVKVFPGGHFFISDQTDDVIKVLDEHFRN